MCVRSCVLGGTRLCCACVVVAPVTVCWLANAETQGHVLLLVLTASSKLLLCSVKSSDAPTSSRLGAAERHTGEHA